MAPARPQTCRPLPLPVFVITGFLGSGKTTLLARLLRLAPMSGTAVVVNELGEVALDHFLVEAREGEVALLEGGCLCCAINDTLADTLVDLYARRARSAVPAFERVVVETTGLADPSSIIQVLETSAVLRPFYRLAGVVAAVDAAFGDGQLDRHPEVKRQVAAADHLFLTKTDVASLAQTATLSSRLRALNPFARQTRIGTGTVLDPADMLEARADLGAGMARPAAAIYGHDENHERHRHHPHDETVRAHSFLLDEPISWAGYAAWIDLLRQLPGSCLLRLKGLLHIADSPRPVVVHGVQHAFSKPQWLDRWPLEDRRSRLVVITVDIPDGVIEKTLAALYTAAGTHGGLRLEDVLRGACPPRERGAAREASRRWIPL